MGKGVDLGLVLPMHERPDDGGKPTWADIGTWARRGEELGADTVWEEADYHRFTILDVCHWSDLRATTSNVGVKLGLILDRLQSANPDKLAGIFGDVAWATKSASPRHPCSISSTPSTDLRSTRRQCLTTSWVQPTNICCINSRTHLARRLASSSLRGPWCDC